MNHEPHEQVLYRDEVFLIQGAIFEVNREMGAGFLEAVYQECLAIEFKARDIPFVSTPSLGLAYKGAALRRPTCPTSFVLIGSSLNSRQLANSRPSIGRKS